MLIQNKNIHNKISRNYSMWLFTICTFDNKKNKHDKCRDENFTKKFSKYLRKHVMGIISSGNRT